MKLEVKSYAIVDDHRFDELNQWRWFYFQTLRGNEYARRQKKGIAIYMHQVVAGYQNPDHKDGNGLNNLESNLRPATDAQQCMNRRLNKKSSSGLKGVSLDKRRGKWQAYIKVHGKQRWLGSFIDKVAAANAYDAKARELFGEYALTNFQLLTEDR